MNLTPIRAVNEKRVRSVEGVDMVLHKKILKLYEQEIERRLLSGNTYAISNERTTDEDKRNTIVFRIKRANTYSGNYRKLVEHKNIRFSKPVEDLLTSPTLRLTMENSFESFNHQILKMKMSNNLLSKLNEIPVSERYKFPKA